MPVSGAAPSSTSPVAQSRTLTQIRRDLDALRSRQEQNEQGFSKTLRAVKNACVDLSAVVEDSVGISTACELRLNQIGSLGPNLSQTELRLKHGRIVSLQSRSWLKNRLGWGAGKRMEQREALKATLRIDDAHAQTVISKLNAKMEAEGSLRAAALDEAVSIAGSALQAHGIACTEQLQNAGDIAGVLRAAKGLVHQVRVEQRSQFSRERDDLRLEYKSAQRIDAVANGERASGFRAPTDLEKQGLRLFWQSNAGARFINAHARHLKGTSESPGTLRASIINAAMAGLRAAQSDQSVILDAYKGTPAFEAATAYLQTLGDNSNDIVSAMKMAVKAQPKSDVQTLYRGMRMTPALIEHLREGLPKDGAVWTTSQFMSFSPSAREAAEFSGGQFHDPAFVDRTVPVMIIAEWPGTYQIGGVTEQEHLVLPGAGLKAYGKKDVPFYDKPNGVHTFHLIGAS